MVWIRNDSVDRDKIGGKKLIVGHTPVPLEMIRKSIDSDKIMLDGGCVYYGRFKNLGYLCALELTETILFEQVNFE